MLSSREDALKRALDLSLTVPGLIVLSPLLLALALAEAGKAQACA